MSVAAAATLASCGTPTSLDSPESASRIRAIQGAATANDRSSIPKLISLLDSDDPAVRFFAIGTLEQMTGDRLGYDAMADESDRRGAAARWETWYRSFQDPAVATKQQSKTE